MKQFFVLFVSVCLLACSSAKKIAGSYGIVNEMPAHEFRTQMLAAVNAYRTGGYSNKGRYYPPVPPLQWNELLAAAAQEQSDYMYKNNTLTHTGNQKSDVGKRITRQGYKWVSAGENVGNGPVTLQKMVSMWMESPQHASNIMNSRMREMGAAKSGMFWTQVFGTPAR